MTDKDLARTALVSPLGSSSKLEKRIIDGKYRLLEEIGRGGMGVVYRAEDLSLGKREVALKMILPEYAQRPEYVELFEKEIEAAAQLQSPHVVHVSTKGQTEQGEPYFVMDFVGKRRNTLEKVLREERQYRRKGLSIERTIRVADQICEALHEAHSLPRPIVHQDLKPANILITRVDGQENVKVGDFGLATGVRAWGEASQSKEPSGTPAYMSPEQCDGKEVDRRADLYALGVILYELLNGERPFLGKGKAVMAQHLTATPPSLPQHVPAPLCELVMQLLEKDPRNRPSDASSVRRELAEIQRLLASFSVQKEIDREESTERISDRAGSQQGERKERNWGYWSGFGGVILVGVLLIMLFLRERQDSSLPIKENVRSIQPSPPAPIPQPLKPPKIIPHKADDAKRTTKSDRLPPEAPIRPDDPPSLTLRLSSPSPKLYIQKMVEVPGGTFRVGCRGGADQECRKYEQSRAEIYVDTFSLDKYEVTVEAYRECVLSGGCTYGDTTPYPQYCSWGKKENDKHPMNCINWEQAGSYCEWAGKRLPTEVEWEKAARGRKGFLYPWGNQWADNKANTAEKEMDGTVPVGSSSTSDDVSDYGIYDMVGNVSEWVSFSSGKASYYLASGSPDAHEPSSEARKMTRGGSWLHPHRRLYRRDWALSSYSNYDLGFRCAQSQM